VEVEELPLATRLSLLDAAAYFVSHFGMILYLGWCLALVVAALDLELLPLPLAAHSNARFVALLLEAPFILVLIVSSWP
jgi:hypothetical protein